METLIVPIQCEALVANDGLLARDNLRWWSFNYRSLEHFRSPEPLAFDRTATGQQAGVYLHWTLPAALRQGIQDGRTGAISYPLVPNRWLVLRVQGARTRTAVGWVLESDCPFTRQSSGDVSRSSPYLVDDGLVQLWRSSGDPRRSAWQPPTEPDLPPVADIGVAFDLPSWREQAAASMFLTAVAPANPLFSGYFPHHGNVFGFQDTLDGVDEDTLSYYVIGWYSDVTRDLLAPAQQPPGLFASTLESLRWTLPAGGTAGRTGYVGACFDIAWSRAGAPPAPDPLQTLRDNGRLNLAVGNTTIDAFSALVSQQLTEPGTAALLRAFNYDLLPVLNQVNGDTLLQERIRQEWFDSTEGGRRWLITEVVSNDGSPTAELTDTEQAWLQALNEAQSRLDSALADLFALQWTVNALWYKRGWLSQGANVFPEPPSGAPTIEQLNAALDPGRPESAAAALVTVLQRVKSLLGEVPQPDGSPQQTREQAFQAGITAFSKARGLDPNKRLKAAAMPRFWRPNNPVVVLSGVQSPYPADPDASLEVRLDGQVLTSFTAGGKRLSRATAPSAFAGLPPLAQLPGFVSSLVDELLLLDPASADSLAAAVSLPVQQVADVLSAHPQEAYQGTLPAMQLGPWSQPWRPLLLEWRGNYTPLDGEADWSFDGSDYQYVGSGTGPPRSVGGISMLSSHTQFVFGARLKTFLDTYATTQPELSQLQQEVARIFQWEFLAQELVGFNDGLALRDTRAFRRPGSTDTSGAPPHQRRLAELVGHDDPEAGPDALPDALRGRVSTVPFIPHGPPAPFQGVRGGQLYFTDLILYDCFGRVLNLLSSVHPAGLYDANNFPAVIDTPLMPRRSVAPQVNSVLELPPRLLQPGRLDIQLADKRDDTRLLSASPDAMPVCGWVVPNHLDNSLLLYGPDGASLGEVRRVVGLDGVTRTARWFAPPHGKVKSVQQLGDVSPHLLSFVSASALQRGDNFTAFLAAIDSTLWTIDPLGGRVDQDLSVLIGRPLALVRVRLRLQLEGRPFRDTGWAATLDPSPPVWLSRRFAVRLGDQATRQDGTIGYFMGPGMDTRYDVFHSVVAPTGQTQTYVRQIGPLGGGDNYPRLSFQEQDSVWLTVLMDPRARMHAATGLFPVKTLELPQRFIDRPLSNLEVCFRIGPLLTARQSSPGTGGTGGTGPTHPEAISHPRPAEQNGTWSWWELGENQTWTGFELTDATSNARLLPVPNSLREGSLQLTIDLKKSS